MTGKLFYYNVFMIFRLIDWIVFYAVSAIFQPYNGGDYIVFV